MPISLFGSLFRPSRPAQTAPFTPTPRRARRGFPPGPNIASRREPVQTVPARAGISFCSAPRRAERGFPAGFPARAAISLCFGGQGQEFQAAFESFPPEEEERNRLHATAVRQAKSFPDDPSRESGRQKLRAPHRCV